MYTDTDTLKKYMGVNFSATLDSFVEKVIAGVQKYIDRTAGDDTLGLRRFEAPTPDDDETRLFDGSGNKRLYVGDLFELTSLTVDDVLLIENEDFFLYPANGEEAYTHIELVQPATQLSSNSRALGSSPYIFEYAQLNVEVIGKFYYTQTADADIELAALKLAAAILKENLNDEDVREVKAQTFDDYRVDYQEVSKIAHALGVNDLLSPYVRTAAQGAKKSSSTGASAGIIKV